MECCGNCKWHEYEMASKDWACSNFESEYLELWTDYGHICDQWEEREE